MHLLPGSFWKAFNFLRQSQDSLNISTTSFRNMSNEVFTSRGFSDHQQSVARKMPQWLQKINIARWLSVRIAMSGSRIQDGCNSAKVTLSLFFIASLFWPGFVIIRHIFTFCVMTKCVSPAPLMTKKCLVTGCWRNMRASWERSGFWRDRNRGIFQVGDFVYYIISGPCFAHQYVSSH